MRLAVFSDIHGNLEALEAVLADIESRQIDEIVSLGDVIGYGCDPIPCLELVQRHCRFSLIGNHEAALLEQHTIERFSDTARISMQWTQNQLSPTWVEYLATLPEFVVENDQTFVHASPFEPRSWRYILDEFEARLGFSAFDTALCFTGHTHIPVIFSESPNHTVTGTFAETLTPESDMRYLISVGSVGQPRDNDPRACYVIADTDDETISFIRVVYDIARTQSKLKAANAPASLVTRLEVGR